MKLKSFTLSIILFSINYYCIAQRDSSIVSRKDTLPSQTSQDAIYARPFINLGRSTTAVGGYLEANTNYFVQNGVPEGFSMEMRRFNIFLYSSIANRIRFLSELEFEHGTEEISLETALMDFEINPALIFRAGVILPPIGVFNVNHDSPRWEFINRPLVSTQIIPATLSDLGFGFNGKFHPKDNVVLFYDIYAVQGLGDGIILNNAGRTFLQGGKHAERFAEDNNGTPMLSGKMGARHRKIGEIGLSYYGGIYNTFKVDGVIIDKRRSLNLMAIDFNTRWKRLFIIGEAAYNLVDVPSTVAPVFGEKQWGFFTDFVYTIIKRPILKWEKSVVNTSIRLQRNDYNIAKFEDGSKVYDNVTAISYGLSFRPSANTILRANYQYNWIRDVLGNPTVRKAGIQVGFASYF